MEREIGYEGLRSIRRFFIALVFEVVRIWTAKMSALTSGWKLF